MHPLAITGIGVVGPLGVGRDAWWRAAMHGASAFAGEPTVLPASKYPNAHAAELWGFDPVQHLGDKGLRNFDRLTKAMIVAAKLALQDAGIKRDGQFVALQPERVGICSSTAYGSLEAITELKMVTELEDPRYLNPARFPNTVINAAAGYVSIWENLRAPNVTIVNGNTGSLDAVLTSSTHLDYGRADAFLVGGGEVLSEALYLAFKMLSVVAEGDAPFAPLSPMSRGMRLGEGSAYVCLESPATARSRGAHVRGVVRGYGTAFEPPESEAVLVHVSPHAVSRAIELALKDAGMNPSQVDIVCSSACGIPELDQAEQQGIRAALGAHTPIAAPKTMYGETFGASGALGLATALCWLAGHEDGFAESAKIPHTTPDCNAPVRTVVVTAVGYYGNVSALVVTRHVS
jgi:3-oxoacyl-[acyl-carrier-protein] synthase II